MTADSGGLAAGRESRRRILRRASFYTFGFIIMAVVVSSVGSALIAWFLSLSGLPFRTTWIALTITVLAVPLIGMVVGGLRKRWRGRGEPGESELEGDGVMA
jgi:hypothetical protein